MRTALSVALHRLCAVGLCALAPAQDDVTRVFIFAGQSNMVGSDSRVEDIQRFPPFAGIERAQEQVRFSSGLACTRSAWDRSRSRRRG